MGYNTRFKGKFQVSPILKKEHQEYLTAFSETRRMKRDTDRVLQLPDPIRALVALPIGEDAAYFVGGTGFFGQDEDFSIVDYNSPPSGQPELWCMWVPSADGTAIKYDDSREKFSNYIEWIEYLIKHFFSPWKYKLNGTVSWQGEISSDVGEIVSWRNSNY